MPGGPNARPVVPFASTRASVIGALNAPRGKTLPTARDPSKAGRCVARATRVFGPALAPGGRQLAEALMKSTLGLGRPSEIRRWFRVLMLGLAIGGCLDGNPGRP